MTARGTRRTAVARGGAVLAAVVLGTAGLVAGAPGASAVTADEDDWAPVEEALIGPGVQMYTEGGQCTSNFVYTDADGAVYVGYSAHCAGTGSSGDIDGCANESLPLGTRVAFAEGGGLDTDPTKVGEGTLVYSSWLAMSENGEDDPDTCLYNDFALVEVDDEDVEKVNPTVPIWGGPVGIDTDGMEAGEQVFSYGMSSLRGDLNPYLSPKSGLSLGTPDSGWTHPLYTITPGIPGDSGSAFLDSEGNAVGSLSTLSILPLPGGNNLADIASATAYAQEHSGIDSLEMVPGTEEFRG